MLKVWRGIDRRGVQPRSGFVLWALLAALATVVGMSCLCSDGHAVRPVHAAEPFTAVSRAYDATDGERERREHLCAAPRHDQCGGKAAADTPATGPGAHPYPQAVPARVEVRPAHAATAVTARPAPPRPPNLHVLQVLRT
ncbi:hypothetical protein [Streptomyces cavernae]|uniref:hypothetical protein n=1 Tax=Streptomyces cavernae TaxID=2259034 RepID=UPI000FEB77F3|nr:hypothetical protein [Streptomyces cavernae]